MSEPTSVQATHIATGIDFEVGSNGNAESRELTERLYRCCSEKERPGRELVECRAHDDEERFASRRQTDGRVHHIYIYLQKRYEGTSDERWVVVHFDKVASHVLHPPVSPEHERVVTELAKASQVAGYNDLTFNLSPTRGSGVRPDLVINNVPVPTGYEAQRRYITKETALDRTRKIRDAGLSLIWCADGLAKWNEKNTVPNIRTNDLAVTGKPEMEWQVVGGASSVDAELCSARNGSLCPVKGSGRFCGQYHPKYSPYSLKHGRLLVYQIAELVPAGVLVSLYAGQKQGWIIVSAADAELWHELIENNPKGGTALDIPSPRINSSHTFNPAPGFEGVLDQRQRDAALVAVPCLNCQTTITPEDASNYGYCHRCQDHLVDLARRNDLHERGLCLHCEEPLPRGASNYFEHHQRCYREIRRGRG